VDKQFPSRKCGKELMQTDPHVDVIEDAIAQYEQQNQPPTNL
jgi:hypothetical protein